MNSLFPRASLKRSPRTRTRKNSMSADMDNDYAQSLASLVRQKSRPPPLQIIAESAENEQNLDTNSPATARPFQFARQHASCITLSAYTFSIDDAVIMFGDDAPRSPALSASSSTSDGASSEDVPVTPGISDGEDEHDFILATPRLRPQRVSVRPLCIMKTRSLVCKEDEDIHNCYESHKEDSITLPVTEGQPGHVTQSRVATELAQESEQDFYVREFEDFVTLSPVVPFVSSPARRDSLTLVAESLSVVTIPRPKPRARSRHSKPLPLLPPVTPPLSSFPSIPTFPLVQTTAQNSVIRRRRNIPSFPSYPPPPPAECRPLPRMSIPLDIDDSRSLEENFSGPIITQSVCDTAEGTSLSSQLSFVCTASASTYPFQPEVLETPVPAMYGEVTLPRSSTDSDAPRSSIDSNTSFESSTPSNRSASPFSPLSTPSCEDDGPECTQRLHSRWSSSTLGSLALEPSRTTTLLSPIKSVLYARTRCAAPAAQKIPRKIPAFVTPPRLPKNKHGSSSAPTLPSNRSRHTRQQGSRSSTSSSGNSSAEPNSSDGSPAGLKRKPIPMLMFLRSS